MRKRASWGTAILGVLVLSLTGCGNGHGLLGPDNLGEMNEDDGVQYAQLWRPCGTVGDRSDVELLADGKTWVANNKADVNDNADNKHQVKVRVNGDGKLEVLEFTHGAKAGEDASFEPEGEHRVALMKVTGPPIESASDKKPKSCKKPTVTPTPSDRRSPSTTPSGTPSAGSTKISKSPTPTASKKPGGSSGGLIGGSGSDKTCRKVNGVTKCS